MGEVRWALLVLVACSNRHDTVCGKGTVRNGEVCEAIVQSIAVAADAPIRADAAIASDAAQVVDAGVVTDAAPAKPAAPFYCFGAYGTEALSMGNRCDRTLGQCQKERATFMRFTHVPACEPAKRAWCFTYDGVDTGHHKLCWTTEDVCSSHADDMHTDFPPREHCDNISDCAEER